MPDTALRSCEGLLISAIEVDARRPFADGLMRRWRFLSDLVRTVHVTTKDDVIRRFLALHVGQACTDLRRAESERILRAQPFLAEASVRAFADAIGGVRILVQTTDEVSMVVGARVVARSPYVKQFKLGNQNLFGRAHYVAAEWASGGVYRDVVGARWSDHQFLGRPYELTVEGYRRSHGQSIAASAGHAFLTDLQRVAWRTAAGSSSDLFGFQREEEDTRWLRLGRLYYELGGVVRIGQPGRLSLFGASVSRERVTVGDELVFVTDSGLIPDTASRIADRYQSFQNARINALWGVRNIAFLPVTGFDALTGTQDVRRGFQLSTLFGRSLSVFGADDDDIFLSSQIYIGAGTQRAFVGVQALAEGRLDYQTERWDALLSTGRAATYLRPGRRNTLVADLEWGAGWRSRNPFQLRLNDRTGGMLAYRRSRAGGAQRGVVTLEDRQYVGRARGFADVGVALFMQAGRLRAGDAPFGINTPIRGSVGVGLLAAIPPRSKRLWRIDVAFPVGSDPAAGWELRFSSADNTRFFWRESYDVARSRDISVPVNVFSWP